MRKNFSWFENMQMRKQICNVPCMDGMIRSESLPLN
jgi:hypothetical protein